MKLTSSFFCGLRVVETKLYFIQYNYSALKVFISRYSGLFLTLRENEIESIYSIWLYWEYEFVTQTFIISYILHNVLVRTPWAPMCSVNSILLQIWANETQLVWNSVTCASGFHLGSNRPSFNTFYSYMVNPCVSSYWIVISPVLG